MRIYHLYIYDMNEFDFKYELVHESEIAAQSHYDALDTVLFVLKHHAKYDDMEFCFCRLFDITDVRAANYLGEEIAALHVSSTDICK